jgi:trans-aconitate methyltransferase
MFIYTESHKEKGYGLKYDTLRYAGNTYDSAVWELEKIILSRILNKRKKLTTLDFACGTGRITSYLEKLDIHPLTGLDVSQSMLQFAKKKLRYTKLVTTDIATSRFAKTHERYFQTILAFRFFLNADPELRRVMFNRLHTMLSDEGKLIFNIHGNTNSVRCIPVFFHNLLMKSTRIFRNHNSDPFTFKQQLSVIEIYNILSETGFRVEHIYSYAFLPTFMFKLLPYTIWNKIENKLIYTHFLIGTHLIFVCAKQ